MNNFIFLLFIPVFIFLGIALTPYMSISTLAYSLLVVGLILRQSKKPHSLCMLSGISLDIAIVLTLEFTRQAINTAVSLELDALQQTHIVFSTIALLLYFPTLVMGIKIYRGNTCPQLRARHRKIAITAFVFRSLGFIFMFSMIS